MREIKFRAWSYVAKKFYEWGYNVGDGGAEFVGPPSGKIDNYQSTGLHDKHGNEIYEGDIVKVSYGIPPTYSLLLVEWNSKNHPDCLSTCTHGLDNKITGWWYKDITNGHDCPMFVTGECFEIIDNIHTHPELTKK